MRQNIGFRVQFFLFIFLTLTYFLKSILRPYPLSGDEPSYLMDAISMGLFHNRQSKSLYADPAIVTSIYPSPTLYAHVIGNSNVTYHGVGLSIFLIPAVFFASKILVARFIVSLIAAASITVIFDLALRITNFKSSKTALVIFIVIGLSAPIAFNSSLLYPEFLCALLLALPLNILHRRSQAGAELKTVSVFIIALSLNYIWWLNTRYIPLAAAAQISVTIYIVKNLRRNYSNRKFNEHLTLIVLLNLANIALMMYFFKNWYGTTNLFFVSQLQPTGLRVGDFAAIYRTAGTYVFGQAEGLIPWAPMFLIAVPGFAILWSRYRSKVFYSAFPAIIYFGTIVQAAALGGSVPPQHYMALLVPFLGIAITKLFVDYKNEYTNFSSRGSTTVIDVEKRRVFWARTKNFSAIIVMSFTIIWSLGLTLSGIVNEGYLYMRSASQESPILPLAKIGTSFWPHYLAPNKDNGSLGVPAMNLWSNNASGNWETTLSQGFRSAGAYEAMIEIESSSSNTKTFVFHIGINTKGGILEVTSKKYEIKGNEVSKISIPFQIYETSEIVWRIESNSNAGYMVSGSDMIVINQQRPSGYSDLGFTVLILYLFGDVYRRELKRQESKNSIIYA